jgi:hypothetical protein
MPKYQLNVAGRNYLIRFHPMHRPAKHGFYTKFFVEASTPVHAEEIVVDSLRKDRSILDFMRNEPADRSTITVEKIFEISDWPDCSRPRMGLAWYPEEPHKAANRWLPR